MKIKTSELIGPALDWAVAKCEGFKYELYEHNRKKWENGLYRPRHWQPSTDWAQGGPIIEQERIDIGWNFGGESCEARCYLIDEMAPMYGPTPLIAAMRALVQRKLGDEIDIPEQLSIITPLQNPQSN
jgi:hypothetical protein